jgi:hypothetical protein
MPHKSWVRGLEPDITPRKRDMLLRRQPLIAKEHDPIFPQNPPDLGHFRPAGRLRQIDPGNLYADRGREGRQLNVIVGHTHLPIRGAVQRGSVLSGPLTPSSDGDRDTGSDCANIA